METLVLPPEDQLARRHYWHTSTHKMKGFLPPMLTPPPSRRRLTSSTLFNSLDRNLDSKKPSSERKNPVREDASLLDRSQGLIPFPRGDPLLRNRPSAPVSKPHFSPVASSVTRSAGNLSSLQSHHGDFSAAKSLESVFRSENEPTQRVKESSERASFVGRPRGGLRTARSLPEKAVLKLSNAPMMDFFEKNSYKEKKTSNKKFSERAFQREALENISMEVKILQRPETREAAIYNLARFKGIPLSELCEENGLLKAAKAENLGSRGFSRLTRRYSSFDKASSLSGDVNLAEVADVDVQSSPEQSLTAKLFDFSRSGFSKPLWASELLAEKWAGPCYTVSPPPSSLPLPKFGPQRQGSSPVGIGDSSPKSKHIQMDTEMATKDLRRILHLDFA